MKAFLRSYRKLIGYGGMTVLGLVVALIRLLTLGYGVAFNRRVAAPLGCRLILLLWGIHVRVRLEPAVPGESCCYFFNHNSILDIFLIPLLGLPNTRVIITEGIKKILPLHLCNLGVEVLYIPDTEKTAERVEFFKAVSEEMRAGKYSVITSPEGRREFRRRIAPFNRGVFHMALASEQPLRLLYFEIPSEIDPLESFDMRCGTVTLRSLQQIDTRTWTLDDLSRHIDEVHGIYEAAFAAANGGAAGDGAASGGATA